MNVERTMQFILDSQARAEARMQKTDERAEERWREEQERWKEQREQWKQSEVRWDRAEARMEKMDARIAANEIREEARGKRLDRKIDAIRMLVRQGMTMLAKTDARLAELAQAQAETQRTLKSFMASLRHRNGSNGR